MTEEGQNRWMACTDTNFGRVFVKGSKINQYARDLCHLLFNYCRLFDLFVCLENFGKTVGQQNVLPQMVAWLQVFKFRWNSVEKFTLCPRSYKMVVINGKNSPL